MCVGCGCGDKVEQNSGPNCIYGRFAKGLALLNFKRFAHSNKFPSQSVYKMAKFFHFHIKITLHKHIPDKSFCYSCCYISLWAAWATFMRDFYKLSLFGFIQWQENVNYTKGWCLFSFNKTCHTILISYWNHRHSSNQSFIVYFNMCVCMKWKVHQNSD